MNIITIARQETDTKWQNYSKSTFTTIISFNLQHIYAVYNFFFVLY
jgi:hypothetical protein